MANIPKHCLYIVVHCDSGQGSTKLGVRILNVPHCRSPTNLDPLCVFEAMETYSNIVVCAKELFKEMDKLHLKWVTINYQFYFLVFFLSSDWKMVSTLHGHSGASSTFFNALDYSVLNDLVPGRIPGGPVLGKYQSVSPFQFVDGRVGAIGAMHPKYREIVGWIWAGTRQRHEIVEDAANYADLERERVRLGQGEKKRHENSVACSSVTKGDPLFNIGAMYVVPAPVHNNLGIVGKSCQALEAFYCALDDEGQTQTETTQRREARKEVERLQSVVEGKERAAKAHHDVLQQSMAELTALRESVEDMCGIRGYCSKGSHR